MSVTIILEIPINPEARDVDAAFLHDLPPTVAFPGNEQTEVLADATRPHTLFLLTRWASEDAYQAYVQWRSTPEGATRLTEIASGPPTIHHFHTHLSF
jgi:heme oxygenase (mycobilin-producing)